MSDDLVAALSWGLRSSVTMASANIKTMPELPRIADASDATRRGIEAFLRAVQGLLDRGRAGAVADLLRLELSKLDAIDNVVGAYLSGDGRELVVMAKRTSLETTEQVFDLLVELTDKLDIDLAVRTNFGGRPLDELASGAVVYRREQR